MLAVTPMGPLWLLLGAAPGAASFCRGWVPRCLSRLSGGWTEPELPGHQKLVENS